MPFQKKEIKKNGLGMYRLYEHGRSTIGYIRGVPVLRQADVKPGDLLIGVDHKQQREFMVEVIPNPNPLNVSLIHYRLVYTVNLKRKGLQVREVKNAEPACVETSQLGFREFWHAELRQKVAA